MKSLLGGSAALTTAVLLATSFLFNARSLNAETHVPPQQSATYVQEKPQLLLTKAVHFETPPKGDATDADSSDDSSAVTENTPNALTLNAIGAATTSQVNEAASVSVLPLIPAQSYTATAYSLAGRTASGRLVAKGLIAADHTVLPLGTRVRIEAGSYSGEYLVADSGGGVRGRKIDVWVPTTGEACRFGRRNVRLTVLSYGKKSATRSRR